MDYNIYLILAIDENYAIGNNDELLYFFPKDLKRFVSKTKEKTVLMGRNTWESLPKKLPKRKNIVLTSKNVIEPIIKASVETIPDLLLNSIESVLELSRTEEIWVIGGASVYKQFIKYAKSVELTKINTSVPNYDTDVKWIDSELELNGFEIIQSVKIVDVNKMDNNEYNIEFITYNKK
jgi:dihydrofolate reductase